MISFEEFKSFILCLFALVVVFVSDVLFSVKLDVDVILKIARFLFYLQLIQLFISLCGLKEIPKTGLFKVLASNLIGQRSNLIILASSISLLVYFKEPLFQIDFIILSIALSVCYYTSTFVTSFMPKGKMSEEKENKRSSTTITYGVGMACSFFEGYLTHVIPGDGGQNLGITRNISIFEADNKVVLPVKKLFIVITKSLICPPNLQSLNKDHADVLGITYLDSCKSLQDVKKDVAGVKNRIYRNSVYQIRRVDAPPVYLVAECATPLHTLYKVMEKRAMFDELRNADVDEIRDDFCQMLQKIIDRIPECRGKCVLVHFDDTDPKQNLADVLLATVKEIAPKFEEIIANNK